MMDMRERTDKLNLILAARNAEFTVDFLPVWKNNHELEAYTLRSPEKNLSPTIYFDHSWFDQSDEDVVDFLTRMYNNYSKNMDINSLIDADYVRENILPRVVSSDNIPILQSKNIAYVEFLDMAVVFYIPIAQDNTEGLTSIQVTNDILESLHWSTEVAYDQAVDNNEAKISIRSMDDVLNQLGGDMGLPESLFDPVPMWIIGNDTGVNGAAAILSTELISYIEMIFDEKMVIMPSSTHELIITPYHNPEDLQEFAKMVHDINNAIVDPEDRLTDSVYIIEDGELHKAI